MYPDLYNDTWLLVFHHNTLHGMFKSKTHAKYSLDPNKFSLLKRIDDSFKIDGKFEFLLKYPNLTGYNHWTQTVNPIKAQPNTENGYVPIEIKWDNNFWHGLSLSNHVTSYLDGSPNADTWFYSIGTNEYNTNEFIPGSDWVVDGKYLKEVNLWIKVTNNFVARKLFQICTKQQRYYRF